jgi:hypothetical protein
MKPPMISPSELTPSERYLSRRDIIAGFAGPRP